MNFIIYLNVSISAINENVYKEKHSYKSKHKLLMTSTSKIELQKLCRFVRIINKGVSTPG